MAASSESSPWAEPRENSASERRTFLSEFVKSPSSARIFVLGASKSQLVVWQWEHRSGWKDYEEKTNKRIEEAYQSGTPFVRVKTGKKGSTPMEIFFNDMIQYDPTTGNMRNVRREGPDDLKQVINRRVKEIAVSIEKGHPRKMVFAQYEQYRKNLLEDIDQKEYVVEDYYYDSGCCASVARSSTFFGLSMTAVCLNCLWLGYDAQYNTAESIYDAAIGFVIAENIFCTFFTWELIVRFSAFKVKRHGFKDWWFMFDLILCVLMAGETWALPLYLKISGSSFSSKGGYGVLRMARIFKLGRLARMARLLRLLPEIVTMVKGIFAAIRSVFFTFLLLGIVIFVFGILFSTQARDNEALLPLFPDVTGSMWLLLLEGVLLDGPKDSLGVMVEESYILTGIFLLFIFLSNFTILNMLIGILCNVVDSVAQTETDEAAVSYLKHTLIDLLECHDEDDNKKIRKSEFELLMQNPEMHLILTRFGVDVGDLISLKDTIFEDRDGHGPPTNEISFAEFLRIVLRLRGNNSAKVTDIVDFRDYVTRRLERQGRFFERRVDLLERRLLGEVPPATAQDGSPVRREETLNTTQSPGVMEQTISSCADNYPKRPVVVDVAVSPETGLPGSSETRAKAAAFLKARSRTGAGADFQSSASDDEVDLASARGDYSSQQDVLPLADARRTEATPQANQLPETHESGEGQQQGQASEENARSFAPAHLLSELLAGQRQLAEQQEKWQREFEARQEDRHRILADRQEALAEQVRDLHEHVLRLGGGAPTLGFVSEA